MEMKLIQSKHHYDKYEMIVNSEEAILTAYGPYTNCNLITIHKCDEEVYRINFKKPYPHSFVGEHFLGGQLPLNKYMNFLRYMRVVDNLNSLPSEDMLRITNIANPNMEITKYFERRIETYSTLAKLIFGFD